MRDYCDPVEQGTSKTEALSEGLVMVVKGYDHSWLDEYMSVK